MKVGRTIFDMLSFLIVLLFVAGSIGLIVVACMSKMIIRQNKTGKNLL